MRRRTSPAAGLTALTLVLLLAAAPRLDGRVPAGRASADRGGRGGTSIAQDQQQTTDAREEAIARARAQGLLAAEAITWATAAGWVGEEPLAGGVDDWEPAIAADPSEPYVYLLATRYGLPKPCPGNCPVPHITLAVSDDGGATWGESHPLCACKGSGQFDPIIEVVPGTGDVYALYMNGFNVVFVKSSDHGETWSEPVRTYGNVSWNDKPTLTASPNGKHVYVSWNGPTGGDAWFAGSHDFGNTWAQSRIVRSDRYFFAYDAEVLSDGTVVFSEGSLSYTGPGASPEGEVWQHAFISHDRGATWENVIVDRVPVGEPCVAEGCGPDFYLGHSGVSADDRDHLVLVYDGPTTNQGAQRIWVRTSNDEGETWSARTPVSSAGENATTPAVEAVGHGDVRLWYMQTSDGDDPDAWNVWYRSSPDGGENWSAPVRISDATSGAEYKTADGFAEIYGDYGEIAVTSSGATIAAWGEGFSWFGPGNVWVNRQR